MYCEGVPVPVTRSRHQAISAGIRQVKVQVLGAEGWVIDVFWNPFLSPSWWASVLKILSRL
jgi:hypothetical protein